MGCVNLLAAAIFAQLDRSASSITPDLTESTHEPATTRFIGWASVAMLSGFAMMALQTTFNRVGALALGASQFTIAMVVAVFVLCIALGSLSVSALSKIPRSVVVGSQWALLLLLFPIYLGLENATYWAHVIRTLFSSVDQAFYVYHLITFTVILVVLAVPIGLSGALLPLLFHELRREVRDLGSMAGRLYAWNTVGSLLGALVGGYILLFWLDLHHIYRIAMGALALGASILTGLVLRPSVRALPALILLPALVAIALLPAWSPNRMTAGTFRNREALRITYSGPEEFFTRRVIGQLVSYEDDPSSTVSVAQNPEEPKSRGITVNGKSDGNLQSDYPTMALSGLIPAVMAQNMERSFVIGWGMGVTAGVLGSLEGVHEVRVAEISHGVINAAPLFDIGNLAATKNPKVTIERGDAYRILLQSSERYDIIVSEPSNPWVTGVEMLYSREFLEAARSRLAQGGVYGQWFHLYECDPDVVALVLRTYATVFPRVSVWFTQGPDLLLLGFDDTGHDLDLEAMERRFQRPDFATAFEGVGIETFPQFLAHERLPLGTLHAGTLEGDIHTLRHPILSYRAARAFFRGSYAWLPHYVTPKQQQVALRNSLLRRYAEAQGGYTEELFETVARETCRFNIKEQCATVFARWAVAYPNSARRRAVLDEVRDDLGATNTFLTASGLTRLSSLYGGKIPAMPDKASLRRAERLTDRFLTFYHYALPFNRHMLEAAWNRCQDEQCDESRMMAEEHVGPLARKTSNRAPQGNRNRADPVETPTPDSR
jgi:spermidine synthase